VDAIDIRLLKLLQDDSSQSLAGLGQQVGLSVSAVNERLKKLRAAGNLRAYVALVDPLKIGYGVCAFVMASVEGAKNEKGFLQAVLRLTQLEECHEVTGPLRFVLKLWARDVPDLQARVEEIKKLSGVARVEVSIVLSAHRDHVTGLGVQHGPVE